MKVGQAAYANTGDAAPEGGAPPPGAEAGAAPEGEKGDKKKPDKDDVIDVDAQ